jgi:hypothetical protein
VADQCNAPSIGREFLDRSRERVEPSREQHHFVRPKPVWFVPVEIEILL